MHDERRRKPRRHVTHGVNRPAHSGIRTNRLQDGAVCDLREGEGVARAGEIGAFALAGLRLAFEGDGAACWDGGLGVDLLEEGVWDVWREFGADGWDGLRPAWVGEMDCSVEV